MATTIRAYFYAILPLPGRSVVCSRTPRVNQSPPEAEEKGFITKPDISEFPDLKKICHRI